MVYHYIKRVLINFMSSGLSGTNYTLRSDGGGGKEDHCLG